MSEVQFNLPKKTGSIIKVIGVGGGGSNAVNHMYNQGITGVEFTICNTDYQALEASPIPHKIQLGNDLTQGLGAGAKAEVGKNAAIETIEEIREYLQHNTKMVFITAGMGGGTGTGAAPIIAEVARELDILTVGIVTMPFKFEGSKRSKQAEEGINELKEHVDTLLVINNDKLRELFGNLKMSDAFAKADNVLTTAAKGIAEIITRTGYVNVDFNDVQTVMRDGGVAIMGSAVAAGEGRAIKAIQAALTSPLLNDSHIHGANYVLLNMEFGSEEISMDEISEITDYIQEEAGSNAEIIWGYGESDNLTDEISITVIATGFERNQAKHEPVVSAPKKTVLHLTDEAAETAKPSAQIQETNPLEPYIKPQEQVEPPKQSAIDFKLDTTPAPAPIPTPQAKPEPPKVEAPKVFDLENDTLESEPKNTNDTIEPTNESQNQVQAAAPSQQPVASTPKINIVEVNEPPKAAEPTNTTTPSDGRASQYEPQEKQANYPDVFANRMKRIRELTMRVRSQNGLHELETIPAYLRKNVDLDDVPHSSESNVSRYSLGKPDENTGNSGLRSNNSFLHDNVD